MKNLTLLILIVAFALGGCAPQNPADPATATSTSRPTFPTRTPTQASFSHRPLGDGLLLVRDTNPGQLLTVVDPANGDELAGKTPISLGSDFAFAFSPDRKMLAVGRYNEISYPHSRELLLIDLKDWSTQTIDLGQNQWVASVLTFSRDGRLVALASAENDSNVMVVDVTQGKLLTQGKTGLTVHNMQFNADGSGLMVYAVTQDILQGNVTVGDPQVGLLDVADLHWRWKAALPSLRSGIYRKEGTTGELHVPGNAEQYIPGVVFAPTAGLLYIVNAEKDELTTIDFAAQTIRTIAIHTELSWLEQLLSLGTTTAYAKGIDSKEKHVLISPDGQTLYITAARGENSIEDGELQFKYIPLGLQIVRVADALQIAKFDTESNDMSLSADGKQLYLRTWNEAGPVTDVLDTLSGKFVASVKAAYLTPTHHLDGRPALISEYMGIDGKTTLAVFSPNNPKPDTAWVIDYYAWWLEFP